MARTFYAHCLAGLRNCIPSMETIQPEQTCDHEEPFRSAYLGSFMALDPCGRYHHCLSPNGVTSRCEAYWGALEKAADRLGGWIESGEGDPTDIFFCLPADEENEHD